MYEFLFGDDETVLFPRGPSSLVAWLFAVDRLDTWVFRVGLAIPLVCIAALVLWHLMSYVAGKLPRKPRAVRSSPEPPSRPFPKPGEVTTRGGPEQWQPVCAEREHALAEAYLELAESWLRHGQPQTAAAVLKKVLLVCPDSPQAERARERLERMGREAAGPYS